MIKVIFLHFISRCGNRFVILTHLLLNFIMNSRRSQPNAKISQASTSQTISQTQTPKMALDQQMKLIRAVGERKQQILEKFSSTVTWRTKRQAWEDIVNDISFPRSAR